MNSVFVVQTMSLRLNDAAAVEFLPIRDDWVTQLSSYLKATIFVSTVTELWDLDSPLFGLRSAFQVIPERLRTPAVADLLALIGAPTAGVIQGADWWEQAKVARDISRFEDAFGADFVQQYRTMNERTRLWLATNPSAPRPVPEGWAGTTEEWNRFDALRHEVGAKEREHTATWAKGGLHRRIAQADIVVGPVMAVDDKAPTSDVTRTVVSVAPWYVLKALPRVGEYPHDLLLAWRDRLMASLDAYRNEVQRIVDESWTVAPSSADAFVASIAGRLEAQYDAVRRDAESASLWSATRDLLPTHAATGVAALAGLGLSGVASADPLLAAGTLLTASVAAALRTVLEAYHRQDKIERRPLYWQYRLKSAEQ